MVRHSSLILIFLTIAFASAQFYSVENPDGSYSFGPAPNQHQGDVGNSVYDLLRKSEGWTADVKDYENSPAPTPRQGGLLVPHLEILQLVETFLKFKGEIASRAYSVVNDNYDIIRSLFQTFIGKIGTLHSFTLIGIQILRKVLEFAVSLLQQWQVPAGLTGNFLVNH